MKVAMMLVQGNVVYTVQGEKAIADMGFAAFSLFK